MAKRIFWRKADVTTSDVPCAPCPFVGVTVNSMDEFINDIIKKRLFRPDGGTNEEGKPTGKYPCVVFSTKDRTRKLLFAGYQHSFDGSPVYEETGRHAKWCLFDEKVDDVIAYYCLQRDADKRRVWELFEDDARVQADIDIMTAIVNAKGGLKIQVR